MSKCNGFDSDLICDIRIIAGKVDDGKGTQAEIRYHVHNEHDAALVVAKAFDSNPDLAAMVTWAVFENLKKHGGSAAIRGAVDAYSSADDLAENMAESIHKLVKDAGVEKDDTFASVLEALKSIDGKAVHITTEDLRGMNDAMSQLRRDTENGKFSTRKDATNALAAIINKFFNKKED